MNTDRILKMVVTPSFEKLNQLFFNVVTLSHHWHWHLIFPVEATADIVNPPDRRGELFYYMHQQILARYEVSKLLCALEHLFTYYIIDS